MLEQTAFGARLRKSLRKMGSATYDAGNTSTIRLPKGGIWRKLLFHLEASLNITTAGTVLAESPLQLIQKLELVADGNKTIWSGDARMLFRLDHFITGKQGALVPQSGTGAAVLCEASFVVLHEALRRINPFDSAFYSEPYSELEVRVTWASGISAIASGATGSVNAATKVTVFVDQTFVGHEQLKLMTRLVPLEQVVTAASTELEKVLPRSGLLGGILIAGDVDGAPVDTIINAVKFNFDTQFNSVEGMTWKALQDLSVKDGDVDLGASGTSRIAGYAFLDLIEDGMISSAPNLAAMNDPKLVLDVNLPSGTTRKVKFLMVVHEPLIAAAA